VIFDYGACFHSSTSLKSYMRSWSSVSDALDPFGLNCIGELKVSYLGASLPFNAVCWFLLNSLKVCLSSLSS
jgi:hypothetical protein